MKRRLTLAVLVFLLSETLAFSQDRFLAGLKAETGLSALDGKKARALTNGLGTEFIDFEPGIAASIGVTGSYYPGKRGRVGFGVEVLANHVSFATVSTVRHNFPTAENRATREYRFYNLLIPVKLHVRHKKITASLGLINTWHVFARMEPHLKWKPSIPGSEWLESNGTVLQVWFNDPFEENDNRGVGASLDRTFTLQAMAGLTWQLNHSFSIGMEYTDYLKWNKIIDVFNDLDLTAVSEHYFRYNNLTLNFQWVFKTHEKTESR